MYAHMQMCTQACVEQGIRESTMVMVKTLQNSAVAMLNDSFWGLTAYGTLLTGLMAWKSTDFSCLVSKVERSYYKDYFYLGMWTAQFSMPCVG